MNDVSEGVSPFNDNRQLNSFRDNLRDGNVSARLHGEAGAPTNGTLKLLEDKVTIIWHAHTLPLLKYLPFLVSRQFVANDVQGVLTKVQSVRSGRQTTNFVRTLKYLSPNELPENDDRCLSLCFQSQTTSGCETMDFEFLDKQTRDLAHAFFLQQAGLEAEEASQTYEDIELPTGLSTRCYQLIVHPSFELAVLMAIVGSMISVAWRSFRYEKDNEKGTTVTRLGMSGLEYFLLVFFTLEQVCKVIGYEGLWPLLQRKWHVFDLSTVLISWLAVLPFASCAGFNLVSLRIFRSLRLFRVSTSFQETIDTFLVALPMAMNAVLCYCYYLVLFAILGMYLFNTSLSYRCAIRSPESDPAFPYVAATPVHFCRINDPVSSCQSNMECVAMAPPDRGYTGFHSFQASFLTAFLITLRSGFGPALDATQQVSSYFSIIYFISLVVFVSYMILSLFVGIVRGSYISVSIVQAAHVADHERHLAMYLKKARVQFPKGMEYIPDIIQLLQTKWNHWRIQIQQAIYQSPLFTRADGTFWSWCRLRQDRIFYVLEPESPIMDRIALVAESLTFEHVMNLVVFVNSVLFAFEYHGMSDRYAARLYGIEHALMLVYGLEFLILAAAAGGLANYLHNPWNRLDFILLGMACLEFILLAWSILLYSDTYARGIFVLRLFRLVRPFRVVRQNNKLLVVLDAILASVPAFLSSIAFHLVLNSVFAVLGMNLFGGTFPLTMQSHFNTFGDSMLTLFKFSNGGSIWSIFHASLQASSFSIALGYYLTYIVLCRFLALNFMLVVLLRHFAMKGDERKKTLSELFQDRMFAMQRIHHFDIITFVNEFSNLYHQDVMNVSLPGSAKKRAQRARSASQALKTRLLNVLPTADFLKLKGYYGTSMKQYQERKYMMLLEPALPVAGKPKNQATVTPIDDTSLGFKAPAFSPDSDLGMADDEWTGWTSTGGTIGYLRQFFKGHWLMADVSLFLFPPQSQVRLKARRLEKETETYIFAVIVLRTLLLTVQSPIYSSLLQEFTTLSDVVYAFVLFFEFAVKVIARGFLFTPHSYLSNTWNQMNLLVLLACSLLLFLPHSTMISLFRLGRAFGPIRVFYRVKTFRVITEALKQSARPLFYCLVLSLFLFYSFATLGMHIFGGRFAYCSDPAIDTQAACHGVFANKATNILTPRVWGNLSGLHFDHLAGAMSSILFLISMKGWLPIVNLAMDFLDDTTLKSLTHHDDVSAVASTYFAAFFIAFLFFTRYFLLKVFAGILLNNFRCYNGTLLLTNLQLMWLRKKQTIVAVRPQFPLPTSRIMQLAQGYMKARIVRGFISTIVLLHTFLLAWIHPSSVDSTVATWGLHYLFAFIYALDAVLRVAAVGWRDFLMKGFTWRTFNSGTAFIMLVGPLLSTSPVLLILGMTRAFDFKHLSLVLERSRGLRTLFRTLLKSVRLTLKVTLLLGYVLFVFAIIGVQVFSLTRWATGLHANLNLTTFPSAYATFVKFAAGEDWYATYLASSVAPPQCVQWGRSVGSTSYATSDCGSATISFVFYNLFYVLVVLILQNLYASTMVDTYVLMSARGEFAKETTDIWGFTTDDLQHFQTIWSAFDTDALGLIHRKHLLAFLTKLEPPLGLGTYQKMRLETMPSFEMTPEEWHALDVAIHQRRRETFHDIEARIAELTYRVRLGLGSYDGLQSSAHVSLNPDVTCPPNMVRFTDLLLVLTMRNVPLESLTVQEKVDELAMRGYAFRHRKLIRIQATFRMFRVRRRLGGKLEKKKGNTESGRDTIVAPRS